MFKCLLISAFCLFFLAEANAQQNNPPGTIVYFRDKFNNPTDKAHVNDVIFIYPADKTSGKNLYPIKEFYTDGTLKLTGTSSTPSSRPILEGIGVTYYPNGQKYSIGNYKYGVLTGSVTFFYPNGKFNSVENYNTGKTLLITCKDSIGNILAENGNGKWVQIYYEDNYKQISEGIVKDSLQDGEWNERVNDSLKYTTVYKKGIPISSTNPNQDSNQVFALVEKMPKYANGGATDFISYLQDNIKYPTYDIDNHISGRVVVTFVVEKDGTLSDVKALRSPDAYIAKAVVDVIKLSPPWSPGMQNGIPCRVQYSIPFNFNLSR